MTLPYAAIIFGQWYLYDRKTIEVQILGESVDLSGTAVVFNLLSEPGGQLLLSKTTPELTVEGTDIVKIPIGGVTEEQLETEYQAIKNAYRAGVFFFELYDKDTPVKIAEGYATIGLARNPVS